MDFGQSTLSGLHQGNAVLGILLGTLQTGDLGAHLLGNGKARGIVTGTVDFVAGRQLLQVLGQGGGVVCVVAVGIHSHDIILDSHSNCFLSI